MIISKIYNFLKGNSIEISFEEFLDSYEKKHNSEDRIKLLKRFISSSNFSQKDFIYIDNNFQDYLNNYKIDINDKSKFWIDKFEFLNSERTILFFKLYQTLFFFGFYETALLYREKFIYSSLSDKNENLRSRANIECGNFEKEFQIKNKKQNIIFNSFRKLILKKDFINFHKDLSIVRNDNDSKFFTNRKILVLGPLADYNTNIKDFDTVILIKSYPKKIINKYANKNLVIYFNSFNIRNGNFSKFYKENFDDISLFKTKDRVNCKKTSVINKNPFLPSGGPMMLQNILFDILIFSPKRIFISGFNFYSSKKIYNDIYQTSNWFTNVTNLRKNFALHDLIANFLFTKNLYKEKLFDCDELTKKVILQSVKQYIVTLKNIY
tara:strand:- start:2353 stop:3492 length:1140 start_codon:yes stop_codon:yes gene_type:complete